MTDKTLTAATYAAASSGLLFGLSAVEFAAYASVALGVLTYLTNVGFKLYDRWDRRRGDRRHHREPVEHDRRGHGDDDE